MMVGIDLEKVGIVGQDRRSKFKGTTAKKLTFLNHFPPDDF